ncbi:serine/threonine/dual specificity protein kinase, catalytic domain-containing protein [Artemisia annua]|uniref:non-specific serine/threonine protein kinase n=1 Tax=Artemisia annua TaxID=35608 RepID=A0A2U1QLD4_ARTAN|nr:serine/threonine/dual specificity protein kinase, catalytic domain-containing protein [Artemisia annua]
MTHVCIFSPLQQLQKQPHYCFLYTCLVPVLSVAPYHVLNDSLSNPEFVLPVNQLPDRHSHEGVIVFKNFDIRHKAGGVDKAVEIPISKVRVTNKTLEIRLQYAGNGTTAVPVRGVFGPLISAISIESEFKPPTHHKRSIFIVLGPVAAALCLILIVSGIALQRGYLGDRISREEELRGLDLQTGVFTYRQIKAATDNFSVSNKLGEGGFGSVYKGTLLDGTLIAVKQLSSRSKQGNREFVNEIGMIAGIQHPNIVRLHGCCVERNHLLLIYEYMENNSLAHALFENNDSNMEIDWATRQRICNNNKNPSTSYRLSTHPRTNL